MDALTRILTDPLTADCFLAAAVAVVYAAGWLSGRRAEATYWAAHAGGGPVRHRGVEYAVWVLGGAVTHCRVADPARHAERVRKLEYRSHNED